MNSLEQVLQKKGIFDLTIRKGPAWKKWLFQRAYEAKKRALAFGQKTPIWDSLIFDKINEAVFGGR